MKVNVVLCGLLAFLLASCSPKDNSGSQRLVNTAHLEHLYEEISIGDTTLGAIWIYCEAPDYQLVADDDEGFTCVDDVARALVFYCRHYSAHPSPGVLKKIKSLSEFLLYMKAESGYFYNFMLPNRQINTSHINSVDGPNWWSWRAFWALSELNLLEAAELKNVQRRSRTVMDRLIEKMQKLCPDQSEYEVFDGIRIPACIARQGADQTGVMMIGLANYYRVQPSEAIKTLMLSLGDQLLQVQQGNAETPPYFAFLSWQNYWHAWGNSQAYALLYAGRVLEYEPFVQAGLNEVRYFYPYCIAQGFIHEFKVMKTDSANVLTDIKPFAQIAYDIRPMIFASLEAYAVTGNVKFAKTAGQLASWLYGNNPSKRPMYTPSTGRTFDGVGSPTEVNLNSGAESTIEALLSLQAIEAVPEARNELKKFYRITSNNL